MRRAVGEARTAPTVQDTFHPSIRPEPKAAEALRAIPIPETEPVLPALRRAPEAGGLADRLRGVAALGVGACVGQRIVRIKGTGALFLQVAVDVLAARSKIDTVRVRLASLLDPPAKVGVRGAFADVILRALLVLWVAGNATVDTVSILAGEAEHTI
ncbi:MAG: hypothetical protein WBN14_11300 [Polyangiales bacterium]